MHKFVAIGEKFSYLLDRHAAALRKEKQMCDENYEMEDNTASEELILSWFLNDSLSCI